MLGGEEEKGNKDTVNVLFLIPQRALKVPFLIIQHALKVPFFIKLPCPFFPGVNTQKSIVEFFMFTCRSTPAYCFSFTLDD